MHSSSYQTFYIFGRTVQLTVHSGPDFYENHVVSAPTAQGPRVLTFCIWKEDDERYDEILYTLDRLNALHSDEEE